MKIAEFYNSVGAPKLPQEVNDALQLGSLTCEQFENDWVRTLGSGSCCVVTNPELKIKLNLMLASDSDPVA